MRQMGPWRRRHETWIDQGAALRGEFGDQASPRRRRRQLLPGGVILACNGRDHPERALGHRWQARARPLHLFGEGALRAWQRIVAEERPRLNGAHGVRQQCVGRDHRLELQRGRDESGGLAFPVAQRVLQLQPDQSDDRLARRRIGRRGRVVELERDRLTLIHQRRIAGHTATIT